MEVTVGSIDNLDHTDSGSPLCCPPDPSVGDQPPSPCGPLALTAPPTNMDPDLEPFSSTPSLHDSQPTNMSALQQRPAERRSQAGPKDIWGALSRMGRHQGGAGGVQDTAEEHVHLSSGCA